MSPGLQALQATLARDLSPRPFRRVGDGLFESRVAVLDQIPRDVRHGQLHVRNRLGERLGGGCVALWKEMSEEGDALLGRRELVFHFDVEAARSDKGGVERLQMVCLLCMLEWISRHEMGMH